MPHQVIIKRLDDGRYLRRKGSYISCTWTDNLQECQVVTEGGAKRMIRSMERHTCFSGVRFETVAVRLIVLMD